MAQDLRRLDSPPPCGEGLGVGGLPRSEALDSPPPCPSPTRGEGTPWRAPRSIATAGFLVGLLSIVALWQPAAAAEVKVLTAGAMRGVVDALVPEFEKRTGHKV